MQIIGQEKRWAALARAFAKNQTPQTLLVSGPQRVGKGTLARKFAQLLLCPDTTEIDGLPAPCGSCRVCHQVNIETYPDFKVFRPLVNSVEDERNWVIAPDDLESSVFSIHIARKFGDEAMRKPLAGPRKVMLIEGADRMTTEAQNSLLKTFEEPGTGLTIVLLCTNPSELLPTVRSRCWHLPIGLVADAEIQNWLQSEYSGRAEHVGMEGVINAVIQKAIEIAAGRPGLAKREVERLIPLLHSGEATIFRSDQINSLLQRLKRSSPVGALSLTEEALRLSKTWWDEDHDENVKKGEAKVLRSSVARFLDELGRTLRADWQNHGQNGQPIVLLTHADALDLIRKTRHYILSNANVNLSLDVMFGRLIKLLGQSAPPNSIQAPRRGPALRQR